MAQEMFLFVVRMKYDTGQASAIAQRIRQCCEARTVQPPKVILRCDAVGNHCFRIIADSFGDSDGPPATMLRSHDLVMTTAGAFDDDESVIKHRMNEKLHAAWRCNGERSFFENQDPFNVVLCVPERLWPNDRVERLPFGFSVDNPFTMTTGSVLVIKYTVVEPKDDTSSPTVVGSIIDLLLGP